MSTRGVIARPNGDSWTGRYHHWDSYPSGLGKTLFNAYHGHFNRDVEYMQHFLLDEHPAGWSTIVDSDFSIKPGWTSPMKGYPGSNVSHENGDWKRAYLKYTKSAAQRRPHCFCHGERHQEAFLYTAETKGSDLDYVYVLSESGIAILYPADKPFAFISWNSDPDWEMLDQAGREIDKRIYELSEIFESVNMLLQETSGAAKRLV